MKSTQKCPECGLQIEPDSNFCRKCGHRLKQGPEVKTADEADLISRSSDFIVKHEKAWNACFEYIKRYPNSAVLPQMRYMVALIKTRISFGLTINEIFPESLADEHYDTDIAIASTIKYGLPPVLDNGIVFETRVSNKVKRSKAIEYANIARELGAQQLQILLVESQQDTESLLVKGKPKAQIEGEGKTVTEAYKDAEIYYQAYKNGDFNGAFRGFEYLKSLSPSDHYFRNMLGVVQSKLSRFRRAEVRWMSRRARTAKP